MLYQLDRLFSLAETHVQYVLRSVPVAISARILFPSQSTFGEVFLTVFRYVELLRTDEESFDESNEEVELDPRSLLLNRTLFSKLRSLSPFAYTNPIPKFTYRTNLHCVLSKYIFQQIFYTIKLASCGNESLDCIMQSSTTYPEELRAMSIFSSFPMPSFLISELQHIILGENKTEQWESILRDIGALSPKPCTSFFSRPFSSRSGMSGDTESDLDESKLDISLADLGISESDLRTESTGRCFSESQNTPEAKHQKQPCISSCSRSLEADDYVLMYSGGKILSIWALLSSLFGPTSLKCLRMANLEQLDGSEDQRIQRNNDLLLKNPLTNIPYEDMKVRQT